MNLQELEKVAEIISNMGDQALDGLTYWLIASVGMDLVTSSILVLFLFGLYAVVNKIINSFGDSSKLQQLRDELGVGCPGHLTDSEWKEVLKMIRSFRGKTEQP